MKHYLNTIVLLLVIIFFSVTCSKNEQPNEVIDAKPNSSAKLLAKFKHTQAVYGIDWHPDGKLIASRHYRDTAFIWNTENKTRQFVHDGKQLTDIKFSTDGSYLAFIDHEISKYSCQRECRYSDYERCNDCKKKHENDYDVRFLSKVYDLRLKHYLKEIASGSAQTISADLKVYVTHALDSKIIYFDGTYFFSSSSRAGMETFIESSSKNHFFHEVKSYSVRKTEETKEGNTHLGAMTIFLSTKGNLLKIFNQADDGKGPHCSIKQCSHDYKIMAAEWQPGTKKITVLSSDNILSLWDSCFSGKQLYTYNHSGSEAVTLKWNVSGDVLAVQFMNNILLFNEKLELQKTLDIMSNDIAWNKDGNILAVITKNKIYFWDNLNSNLTFHESSEKINDFAWNPEFNQFALATEVNDDEGFVEIWEIDSSYRIIVANKKRTSNNTEHQLTIKEETVKKLTTVRSLIKQLQKKEESLSDDLRSFQTDVDRYKSTITDLKLHNNIASYKEAVKNDRINNYLVAMQKALAYMDFIKHELLTTSKSLVESEGTQLQLELDAKILDSLDENKLDQMIAQLDLVITKIQPNAQELVIKENDTQKIPLEKLYNEYFEDE